MLVLLVFVTGVVILHHCLGDCKFSVYRLRFVIEWFINYLGLKVSDDSGSLWIALSMVFLTLTAVFGTLWFVSNQNYSTLMAAYNALKLSMMT